MNIRLVPGWLLAGMVCLLTACDNSYDYHFQVANQTNKKVLVTLYEQAGSKVPTRQQFVAPNATETVLIVSGGLCGNKCPAPAIEDASFALVVPRMVITQSDSLRFNRKSQNSLNWFFQSKDQLGVYTMYVHPKDLLP